MCGSKVTSTKGLKLMVCVYVWGYRMMLLMVSRTAIQGHRMMLLMVSRTAIHGHRMMLLMV